MRLSMIMGSPIRTQMQWLKAVVFSRLQFWLSNSYFQQDAEPDLQLLNQIRMSSTIPKKQSKKLQTTSRHPHMYFLHIQQDWEEATEYTQVIVMPGSQY
eukprot:698238-Ditylum_brightwellii.AAC.1